MATALLIGTIPAVVVFIVCMVALVLMSYGNNVQVGKLAYKLASAEVNNRILQKDLDDLRNDLQLPIVATLVGKQFGREETFYAVAQGASVQWRASINQSGWTHQLSAEEADAIGLPRIASIWYAELNESKGTITQVRL